MVRRYVMKVRADLHIHSLASDGKEHPCTIVKYALRRGIRVISITDHDTFAGSILANRCGIKGVTIVYGAEIRTNYGDVLVLCDHYLKNVNKDLMALVDISKSNGCLVIPAHPLNIIKEGIGLLALSDIWDGVEIFNGGSDPFSNFLSLLLFKNYKKVKLANSDAHVLSMIGSAHNILTVNDLTLDDVLEAIRRGEVKPVIGYSLTSQVERFSWSLKRYLWGLPTTLRLNI